MFFFLLQLWLQGLYLIAVIHEGLYFLLVLKNHSLSVDYVVALLLILYTLKYAIRPNLDYSLPEIIQPPPLICCISSTILL